WDIDWLIEIDQFGICSGALRTLDLALHVVNVVEILIEASPIRSAHVLLEFRDVHTERIQQTSSIAQFCAARRSISAFVEQPLEDDARMRLSGERCGRRRP